MSDRHIHLVRVPHAYRFDAVDVREEPILTLFGGYLEAIGFDSFKTFDFHLQRGLCFADTIDARTTDYVISVRETGDQIHYLRRYVKALSEATDANIWLYGQTGRLAKLDWPERVRLVRHDEREMAAALGLSTEGPGFTEGLTGRPYAHLLGLEDWQRSLWRGSMETTRGCHFPCRFCFINAGDNYPQRWQVRPIAAVLADLARYREHGVNSVAFYDAEFIGAVRKGYDQRRELLRAIRSEAPGTEFMIWARADTLLAFDDFELLKSAGLVNVFIGVESFVQGDLDSLNKKTTTQNLVNAITRLRDMGIYVHMSFITFNRNTTVSTLRENLDVIENLMAVNPRMLGLPHFSFTFESSWDESRELRTLSNRTYMSVDIMMRAQQADSACFDPELEPLMEVFRLLKYEWSRKVTELTMARLTATPAEQAAIESWFAELGRFCIRVMRQHLELFDAGALNFDTLDEASDGLFRQIADFYARHLPPRLQGFVTRESHAGMLNYSRTELVEEDQYWADHIPYAPAAAKPEPIRQVVLA